MRLGVLSDVHANLDALEAVLARLEGERIDRWLCAGDLVGYGPHPDACVDRVLGLPDVVCVTGNHDLIALGELSDAGCVPLARQTLAWTRSVLAAATADRLAALPLEARVGPVLMTHGALGDPAVYTERGRAAREQLAALPADAEILLLGHTHRALAVREGTRRALLHERAGNVHLAAGRRHLLNPGSVGQSRDRAPLARAMVLDLGAGRAEFVAVEYDVRACRAALRERGLPENACHVPPRPRWRRLAGRARKKLGI